jgi:hypothetical protein
LYSDVHIDYSKGTSSKSLFQLNRYQSFGRRGKTNIDDVGKFFPSSFQLENSAKMYITMISSSSPTTSATTTAAAVNRM